MKTINYHREHFLSGFIGEPTGHWKALLKSLELPSVVSTLRLEGGWGLVRILFTSYCFVLSLHQTWAKLRKKSCSAVSLRSFTGKMFLS